MSNEQKFLLLGQAALTVRYPHEAWTWAVEHMNTLFWVLSGY